MDNILWISHNIGFVDQMRPEWVGVRSAKHQVQGQVLCPSIPEAREVCMQNHRNLLSDLVQSGIEIDQVAYWPYDDGGCACEKCQPYYPTFLAMIKDVHAVVQQYYPGIEANICGWWTFDKDIKLLTEFKSTIAKDWLSTFYYSATYDVFEIPLNIKDMLGDILLSTFFHIGFSHYDRDAYIKTGIHSAPLRIQSVISSFDKAGSIGFNTYNESFGDHYNAFLCGQLGRNPEADVRDLTGDYCRQMYSVKGQNLKTMVDVLMDIEFLQEEKAEAWFLKLNQLRASVKVPECQQWAFEHVILKAELMALDYKIGNGEQWNSPEDVESVLALIEKRIKLSEKLWRHIYGFGILRHILISENMMPEWYEKYLGIFPSNKGKIKPGMALDEDS